MKIIQNFKTNPLCEIVQQKQIQFAHAKLNSDGDLIQIHQDVLCRDFLGDVILSCDQKKPYKIYGMAYDPSVNDTISEDYSGVIIKFPKGNTDESNFKANFKHLNSLEKTNGLSLSECIEVSPGILFVKGDKFWTTKIYLNSFYTFILRCLSYDATNSEDIFDLFNMISTQQTNEANYINKVKKYLVTFANTLTTRSYSKYIYLMTKSNKDLVLDDNTISEIHNRNGFVSLLTNNNGYSNFSDLTSSSIKELYSNV